MDEERERRIALEMLDEFPDMRARLEAYCRQTLKQRAKEDGFDPETFITDWMVEEAMIRTMVYHQANLAAKVREHIPDEEPDRWYREEYERLASMYPEGIPKEVLEKALLERIGREMPDALKPPGGRKEG